jgi:hypothetical protein
MLESAGMEKPPIPSSMAPAFHSPDGRIQSHRLLNDDGRERKLRQLVHRRLATSEHR